MKNISENLQPPVGLQDFPPVDSLLNVNSCEKNRGVISSTDNLKDSQNRLAEISTDKIGSSKPSDQLNNETLNNPEAALTENVTSSDLLLKEQEIKEAPICEGSSWISSSDGLSSDTDDSEKNIVGKETRENYNPNMSQPENSLRSCSESVAVNMLGAVSEPNPASICEASELATSLALNHDIDEKVIGLSLDEVDECLEDDVDIGEDIQESMSDLKIGEGGYPPNFGDLVPENETVDVEIPSYDPSLWTPMEIATATGNANSSILEHPLKLRSTYSEVVGSSGTRDSNGEPLVTSYNTCFMGTVDYIWRSEGLHTIKVLAPISKDAMQPTGGFPTKKWGSDHIALASELAFVKK